MSEITVVLYIFILTRLFFIETLSLPISLEKFATRSVFCPAQPAARHTQHSSISCLVEVRAELTLQTSYAGCWFLSET